MNRPGSRRDCLNLRRLRLRPWLIGLTLLVGSMAVRGEMPAEYGAVFWPPEQPAAWRQPGFFTVEGSAGGREYAASFDVQVLPAFWGTRSAEADQRGEGRGVLTSQWFETPASYLVVGLLGSLGEKAVALENEDGRRAPMRAVHRVDRSTDMPAFVQFDLPALAAGRWRLRVVDDDPSPDRWVAVSTPIPAASEAEVQALVRRWRDIYRNDFTYFRAAIAITAALLGLPLLAATFRRRWVTAFWLGTFASLVAWAAVGGLRWWGWDGVARVGALILWWGGIGAATAAVVGWWRLEQSRRRLMGALAVLYLAGLALAHLQTVPDVPLLGEYNKGTVLRARMIASPPDNLIPFLTAIYVYHHKDGREDRALYFGREWSIGSRGPLLPLVISALFVARGNEPHDPAFPASRRWPADDEGFHVARSAAIALNGLAALAVAALAAVLAPGRRAARAAVAAAALAVIAPFFASNLAFVWPKLLAASGVILAAALIIRGRKVAAWPALLALGYYAHPLAALFWPTLLWLELWPLRRAGWKAGGKLVAVRLLTFVLLLAPWLSYKLWLGHPDVMLRYVLGDGRDFAVATSWSSWLECRWLNTVRTFVPLVAWWGLLPFPWFGDRIAGAALWSVAASRSLFGGIGLAASVLLLISLRMLWFEHRRLLAALLLASLTIVVYWGYTNIGLGRQCLEPITAAVVALLGVAAVRRPRWLPWVVALVGAELLLVIAAGVDRDGLNPSRFLLAEEWLYGLALVVVAFVPAAVTALARKDGERDPV